MLLFIINYLFVMLCWQVRSRVMLDSRCHSALQVDIYSAVKNVKTVTCF